MSTGRCRRVPAELHRSTGGPDARHGAGRVLAVVAVRRVLPQQRRHVLTTSPTCLTRRSATRRPLADSCHRRRRIAARESRVPGPSSFIVIVQ